MQKENSKISCPTFHTQELLILRITSKINKSIDIREKTEFVEELKGEVDVMLSCDDYDNTNINCRNCHLIADMCCETANLIMKANKLS